MFRFPELTVDNKLMIFCRPALLLVTASAPVPDRAGFYDGNVVTITQEWKSLDCSF
jgi:hypothetical protein